MTPEGEVKAEIKKVLASYGDELYSFWPVQTGYGVRTIDCIVCYRGRFIAIEVKRKGMRARRFQERILDQISKAGGSAIDLNNVAALQDMLACCVAPSKSW